MVPTQRVHWRTDCCPATSYEHSSYCWVFTLSLPSNGNTLPIVGQEFVFAGTCLPSCSLATDIHVKIFNSNTVIVPSAYKQAVEEICFNVMLLLQLEQCQKVIR
jgi:hypothetical protein